MVAMPSVRLVSLISALYEATSKLAPGLPRVAIMIQCARDTHQSIEAMNDYAQKYFYFGTTAADDQYLRC
jgi:hypothetical protein